MSMTPEQVKNLYARLRNQPTKGCPNCGNSSLSLKNRVFALCGMADDGKIDVNRAIPVVPLACNRCGCLLIFSATQLGVE